MDSSGGTGPAPRVAGATSGRPVVGPKRVGRSGASVEGLMEWVLADWSDGNAYAGGSPPDGLRGRAGRMPAAWGC